MVSQYEHLSRHRGKLLIVSQRSASSNPGYVSSDTIYLWDLLRDLFVFSAYIPISDDSFLKLAEASSSCVETWKSILVAIFLIFIVYTCGFRVVFPDGMEFSAGCNF